MRSPSHTFPTRSILMLSLCLLLPGLAQAAIPALEELQDAFIQIGDKIRPSVVNIEVERALPSGLQQYDEEDLGKILERFFGRPLPEGQKRLPMRMRPQKAAGSGIILDREGYIMTNNHVVEGAGEITVRLWHGEEFKAEVVGQDSQTDIALIKIEANIELQPAVLGDSDGLRVGQFAIAAGNPQGLKGSLSFGHITALKRDRDEIHLPDDNLRFFDFIQTDAAINLGNSGGPLCNIDGEVIGINVATVWSADALGFAIPINTAKKILADLKSEGKVVRGYLGVEIRDAKDFVEVDNLPDGNGAYVHNVVPDTPADRAGIKLYDVIRKLNGTVVTNANDLVKKISDMQPDETVAVEVWRDGATRELTVHLEAFPDESPQTARLGKQILGLQVSPLNEAISGALGLEPNAKGVVVESVEVGSAAYDADIRENDVIIEVAKKAVEDPQNFRQLVDENAEPGKSLLLRIIRPGTDGSPFLTIVKVPENTEGAE